MILTHIRHFVLAGMAGLAIATSTASAAEIRALCAGSDSYGRSVCIGGCFASRPWLRFSIVQSNTGGPTMFQAPIKDRWVGVVPG